MYYMVTQRERHFAGAHVIHAPEYLPEIQANLHVAIQKVLNELQPGENLVIGLEWANMGDSHANSFIGLQTGMFTNTSGARGFTPLEALAYFHENRGLIAGKLNPEEQVEQADIQSGLTKLQRSAEPNERFFLGIFSVIEEFAKLPQYQGRIIVVPEHDDDIKAPGKDRILRALSEQIDLKVEAFIIKGSYDQSVIEAFKILQTNIASIQERRNKLMAIHARDAMVPNSATRLIHIAADSHTERIMQFLKRSPTRRSLGIVLEDIDLMPSIQRPATYNRQVLTLLERKRDVSSELLKRAFIESAVYRVARHLAQIQSLGGKRYAMHELLIGVTGLVDQFANEAVLDTFIKQVQDNPGFQQFVGLCAQAFNLSGGFGTFMDRYAR